MEHPVNSLRSSKKTGKQLLIPTGEGMITSLKDSNLDIWVMHDIGILRSFFSFFFALNVWVLNLYLSTAKGWIFLQIYAPS